MNKRRLVVWSLVPLAAAGVLGFRAWVNHRVETDKRLDAPQAWQERQKDLAAKSDKPPAPWSPKNPWWKKVTIDAYDAAGNDPGWPSARRAVVAFGKAISEDPRRNGDEPEDAADAARTALEFNCDDPLVLYILAHYGQREGGMKLVEAPKYYAMAAERFPKSRYPAVRKCVGLLEAAAHVGNVPKRVSTVEPARAAEYAEAGLSLLPEVFADGDLPVSEVLRLVDLAGDASKALRNDRAIFAERCWIRWTSRSSRATCWRRRWASS